MSENFVYYGKHKRKNESVRQITVRHDNRFSGRFSQDTWKEIYEFMDDNDLNNVSNVVETLISDSLLDYKISKQQFELKGIDE